MLEQVEWNGEGVGKTLKTFESPSQAVKALGMPPKSLDQAIRKGSKCYGYYDYSLPIIEPSFSQTVMNKNNFRRGGKHSRSSSKRSNRHRKKSRSNRH
jgi:hypothetical protein